MHFSSRLTSLGSDESQTVPTDVSDEEWSDVALCSASYWTETGAMRCVPALKLMIGLA